MIKKFLALSIFLLALSVPLQAQQEQQNPPPTDGSKAADHSRTTNVPQAINGGDNNAAATSKVGQGNSGGAAAAEAANVTDYYKIGLAHYKSKQFKDAVDDFKRALRFKPLDAEIHYNLGLAYYSSNQYKQAMDSYKQAVKLKPDWSDAHFRLGWIYYILGKKDSSFEQYKILQQLNPEQANTLFRIIKVDLAKETAAAAGKTGDKAGNRTEPQPDPKEEVNVESRLVISDISPPAPLSANVAPDKDGSPGPNPAETNKAATPTETSKATTSGTTNAAATATGDSSASAGKTSAAAPLKSEPTAKALEAEAVAPVDEGSLVKTYRVGVGDVLDIRTVNTPTTRSTLYTVMDGGLIEYPLAGGSLSVNGLTTEEINSRLSAELKRRAVSQNGNEMVVSVRDYASHTVVINGLVNSPGMRILHREAVPLYVVLADAQPRAEASRALIMRASGQITVDLTDPARLNALVRPGDVITVSARPPQFYYLGGKIMTPGQKPFQPGITLVQAILAAGGLERAHGDVIEISREGESGRLTTTKYKLKEIRSGKVPDPRLEPGDRIEVSH